MSHCIRELEVKLWQQRAPCSWAMKDCVLCVLVPGEGGKCYCFQLWKPWSKMGSQVGGDRRAPVWWQTKPACLFYDVTHTTLWQPRQVSSASKLMVWTSLYVCAPKINNRITENCWKHTGYSDKNLKCGYGMYCGCISHKLPAQEFYTRMHRAGPLGSKSQCRKDVHACWATTLQ